MNVFLDFSRFATGLFLLGVGQHYLNEANYIYASCGYALGALNTILAFHFHRPPGV